MLRDDLLAHRLDEHAIGLERVEGVAKRVRNADGRVDRVEAVAGLHRSELALVHESQARGLEHRSHRRVHDGGPVTETMFES